MARDGATRRSRGMIRRRGGSFQVIVYAGKDPLTGRDLKLHESTTDEREAERILRRLVARAGPEMVETPRDARALLSLHHPEVVRQTSAA